MLLGAWCVKSDQVHCWKTTNQEENQIPSCIETTMADRSRSRSPDRRVDDQHHSSDAHNGGDNGDDMGAGPTGDEVKLYVGNLDYGTLAAPWIIE